MSAEVSGQRSTIAFYGFRGGPGGISHVMLNLMNATVDLGHEVHLLLNATAIPELVSVRPEIRVVHLGEGGAVTRIRSLARYLKAEGPDFLLTNREPANRAAIFARNLSGVPVKIAFRVGMAISSALDRRQAIKRWLRRTSIVYCYRRADLIIANAHGVARDIEQETAIPLRQIRVLNNPTVSSEVFAQAAASLEHPWFAPGSPPVILGVGRLVRQKDFPTLLRAFSRVRERRPCRLVILGEGKEREALGRLAQELRIQEDVDLPGFAENPFAFMSRAGLFVLSSAWEGSPNVLIQALALGVPSVSTDCPGGSREIMQDGRFGHLVPVGDVAAMAVAIEAALDAPLPREVLQSAADPFRAERCARDYLEAFASLTK